jgi:hypothetical protein
VFASDTRWTVVRGSDLEEGESQGLPVWSRHVGDHASPSVPLEPPDANRGEHDDVPAARKQSE